jgi:hypothetical protein
MMRQIVRFLARTACAVTLALLLNLAGTPYLTTLAATNGEGTHPESEIPVARSVERELTETEDKWLEANIRGDAKVAAGLLAEDYQGMTQSGAVEDKAQFVAGVKDGSLRADSFYQDQRSVRIFGETAVSTGRLSLKAQDGITQTRYTRVYVKRQGRWQLIIMQTTRITR